ncbi:MAG: hypothetical protein U1E84_16690 [Rhodoferax sp.]
MFLMVGNTPLEEWADLVGELSDLSRFNIGIQPAAPHLLMQGRKRQFSPWAMLLEVTLDLEEHVLAGIGAEIVRSIHLNMPVSSRTANQIRTAIEQQNQAEMLRKLSRRLIGEVVELLAKDKGTPSIEIKVNYSVRASLMAQMNPDRTEQRKAAGSRFELTLHRARSVAVCLRDAVENDCAHSLQIAVAFVLGLPWDVSTYVRFSHKIKGDWAASIDVTDGIVRIDLSTCLPSMARSQSGHVPSSPVIARPLPGFVVEALHRQIARLPDACCLADLSDTQLSNTSKVPVCVDDPVTIAKFIATRGSIALAAGLQRSTAAYCAVDFTKTGKAKHYYLTFAAQEISQGCEAIYKTLGWWDAAPILSIDDSMAVGSRATPSRETIQAIDGHLVSAHHAARAGRKYTLESINKQTNSLALLCAWRCSLLMMARSAETYDFTASAYIRTNHFCSLDDKRAGPLKGLTPLPISQTMHAQSKLWLTHLSLYDARLEKLGVPSCSAVRRRIDAIQRGQSVPLFFLVEVDGAISDIGSSEIKEALPVSLQLKSDGGRHFMQNAIRKKGIPDRQIDAAARHHVDGISLHGGHADIAQIQWLSATAHVVDEIAISLGIFPVAGLGTKGAK